MLKLNIIRVPEGCPTMNQALDLAVVFSERNDCTRENPVKIEVGEGEHEMVGLVLSGYGYHTRVSCSNMTIVGKGKGKTTILGGFCVHGKQNVKIEQLVVTNAAGFGLLCDGIGTNVHVTECCFKKCDCSGMKVHTGATVTATRCEFMENDTDGATCDGANTKVILNDSTMHHNQRHGLYGYKHAVVNLYGTKTDIHSNKCRGIYASLDNQINVHLPSQHNTTHDNGGDNQYQETGGSIVNSNFVGRIRQRQLLLACPRCSLKVHKFSLKVHKCTCM